MYMYWPGINGQIDDLVAHREMCQLNQPKNTKEPSISVEILSTVWTKLGIDLCELNDNHYMVMTDYNMTVIKSIKSVLSEHRNIRGLVSDNGPCFKSHEFDKFVQIYGIVHTTISQHHHQSYGMAERCIRTIKGLIRKNEDPWMALLIWRSTPVDGDM